MNSFSTLSMIRRYSRNITLPLLTLLFFIVTAFTPNKGSVEVAANVTFRKNLLPAFLDSRHESVSDTSKFALAAVLNADGSLKKGITGTYDPTGYTMRYGANGEPVFIPLGAGDDRWQSMPSLAQGVNGTINAVAVTNSNLVYVGGSFSTAGGVSANNIALWNGSGWSALGTGVNGVVYAIDVDGSNVYAGGDFSSPANLVARWNGTSWSALGTGIPSGAVRAIAVSGDGDVYVGGLFSTAGSITSAGNIARWNPASGNWFALGSPASGVSGGAVVAIGATAGTAIYVGGSFTSAGGVSASRIAYWSGTAWSALGAGRNAEVSAIAVSGNNVYAGGSFTGFIARWDISTSTWNAMGSGFSDVVKSIAIGPGVVYAGGPFITSGSTTVNRVAAWNGSAWSALSSGIDGVNNSISVNAIGIGFTGEVFAGGNFTTTGSGASVNRVSIFKGGTWSPLGYGINGVVQSVSVSGANVYVAGTFTAIGSVAAANIARWNGTTWSALGSGLNGSVYALSINGTDIYAGGAFTTAGGTSANNIARWNGTTWSALGSGVSGGTFGTGVRALSINNDNLYVGGFFTSAGGTSANRIARWNITNSTWSALATGISGGTVPAVFVIEASSSNVYVGGTFTTAGGNAANNIAVWNGSAWSSLGSGVSGGSTPVVFAIAVTGSTVYAGGDFTAAGSTSANRIAAWNGTTWSALGSGVNNVVYALSLRGNALYAGGDFTTAGSGAANRIAVWNGLSWTSLGTGLSGLVRSISVTGTNVFAGGDFTSTGDGSVAAVNIIQRNGVIPVTTLQAAQVIANPTGVKLTGTVNPGNLTGSYYFEYGTTSANLNQQTNTTAMSGTADIAVSENVFAVTPNTTYYYRLRAENAEGISYSAIQSYTFPPEVEVRQNTTVLTSGSEYDFGSINYLASSSAVPFTLYNLGLGNLNLTGTAGNLLVKGGANPADFIVVQSSITSPVAYNTTQPFTVQFNPQAGGVRTATLTITSNDPNEPNYVINLKGTGVKLNQTIAFGALPVRVFGEAPFALTATASSGLTVNYTSSAPSVATISGNTVTLVGPGTSIITSSQPGNGNYNAATDVPQTLTVRAIEPVAQPTALTFSAITSNSMNGVFTAAAGSPAGYIVLRKEGGAVTDQPEDGTTYVAGSSTIGTSTVISVGSGITFSSAGLNSGSTYHYAVFAFNGSGVTINYRQTSPLQNSQATIVSEPVTQASAISFSNLSTTALTVNWNNGSGSERLVIARQASAVSIDPTDGIAYTGNPNFSAATDLGSGNKVVFRGSGNSVTVTNLQANTVYHFHVYELNGADVQSNYLITTTTNNPNSRTTLQTEPLAQPTALTFNNITVSSLGGSFTASGGSPTGYLVLRKAGGAPSFTPADGTAYSAGVQSDAVVVSSAAGTTFTDAGLVAGTTYRYAIYAYNGTGQSINYRTATPLTNNVITISSAPVATAATAVSQTSFTANWSAVTGAVSYSLDVSSDNFSNLIAGYAAKNITGLNDAITGLNPGVTYQYRVRAVNASGLSDNSNPISQITIPSTPSTSAAQEIRINDFKAVWNTSSGATSYELDVSQNNFTTFITGYQSKSIPAGVTEEVVTGLSPLTQYQYRVRSVNAGGVSPNSGVTSVTTLSAAGPLTVTNPAFTNSATATISITLSNGSGSRIVKFYSRGILESMFAPPVVLNSESDTYTTTITPAQLDELGIEFYFTAEDASTAVPKRSPENTNSYIYTPIASNTTLPGLSFGGELKNYRIISIPYELTSAQASIVFSAFGGFDKTKWRLVRWEAGTYKDQTGTINVGRSYWFNAREKTEIELNTGTVSQNNQTTPFSMQLQQGWNMVATPYPFAIQWSDVLDNNPTADVDPEYHVYTGTGYSTTDNMEPFKGGFVFANEATTLRIPVNIASGGARKPSLKSIGNNPDAGNWMIPLTLKYRDQQNTLLGFGMHEEASLSKDRFDVIALPQLDASVNLSSHHPEYFAPDFARDIVPTQDNYVWTYVLTASDHEPVTLHWDNKSFENINAQVLLYDARAGVLLDMSLANTYPATGSRALEFIYSKNKRFTEQTGLGRAYPNPFTKVVSLPAFLNTTEGPATVFVSIKSLTGVEVYTEEWKTETLGLIQPEWNGTQSSGYSVASGVYVYHVKFSNSRQTIVTQGKILKQ